jgi:glycosyltransferase involved in cell wall biosynthesis
LRLAALVEGPTHVCCRYRVAAFRTAFAAAGYSLDLFSRPSSWWSRLSLYRQLRSYSVVLVQRKLMQSWQLRLLRHYVRTLIFDFDDAVFLRDSHSKKAMCTASRRRRFKTTVQSADLVIAGNNYLASAALPYAGSEKVYCIPTCVEVEGYPIAKHQIAGVGVVLAWIGSASTLKGLEALRPILEECGRRYPGLSLRLICDRFFSMQSMHVQQRPWSEASEALELATSDIGLSWLPDDAWSRGKCGLKVLQYMAAGLPVVANPVGTQADLVRHGETGFLATRPEEWTRAIANLANNPELRRRMGCQGRQYVQRHFSISVGSLAWQAILSKLKGRQAA